MHLARRSNQEYFVFELAHPKTVPFLEKEGNGNNNIRTL